MVSKTGSYSVPFTAMASVCEVRLAADNQAQAEMLAREAIAEVARIERVFSRYRPDSVISRINAAAGKAPVAVDSETAALLDYAGALFETSAGRFDISSGVLRRAWDFRQARLPDKGELDTLLKLVGWDKVRHADGYVELPLPGMELDFGGFGKEYAADRAAALLSAAGVRHGYVNLGGDLNVIGPQPDGKPWLIGIQDPRDDAQTIASIPVSSGGLATSGDYERFLEIDGQRYCHILDPRSGYPVRYWRSVSVLAPLGIAAGSYATIAMLMEEDGLAFLQEAQLAYLAIDHKGQVFNSG